MSQNHVVVVGGFTPEQLTEMLLEEADIELGTDAVTLTGMLPSLWRLEPAWVSMAQNAVATGEVDEDYIKAGGYYFPLRDFAEWDDRFATVTPEDVAGLTIARLVVNMPHETSNVHAIIIKRHTYEASGGQNGLMLRAIAMEQSDQGFLFETSLLIVDDDGSVELIRLKRIRRVPTT